MLSKLNSPGQELKQESVGGRVAHPKKLYTRIAVRDNAAYIYVTTGGLIPDCFIPENYVGMTTASAVSGHNISEYLSPSALKIALGALSYVSEGKGRFSHGFIMRIGERIINRFITQIPGTAEGSVDGFIKSLNAINN